jgi:phospholipid-translocating ATPase
MSVIVKNEQDGKHYIYTKGADSSVFPLCTATSKDIVDLSEKQVEDMARKGLRTLCYGMKAFDIAGRDVMDIEYQEVECNLTLIAATGVEDLLQEDVKSCIEDFRAAGISVWMLTGDKGLTAKEIGVSCGLIPLESSAQSADNGTEKGGNVIYDFEEMLVDPTIIFENLNKFLTSSATSKKY